MDNGIKYSPDCVWPIMTKDKIGNDKLPGNIWRPIEASVQIPSNISCIKCPGKHTRPTDDCSGIRNALYPSSNFNLDKLYKSMEFFS